MHYPMLRSSHALLLVLGLNAAACQNTGEAEVVPPRPVGGGVAGGTPSRCVSPTPTPPSGTASTVAIAMLPLGTTRSEAVPPPPISGGTLLATRDGQLLVAADSDRDQLYFVDSRTFKLLHVQKLAAGDEPGRLVEDGAGRIHVALRSGHAIATLSREPNSPILRRDVCDLPRGLAYDAMHEQVLVACAEGKLVSVPAATGAATGVLEVGRDARDVIVRGDMRFVTHFRSAELLTITADGSLLPPQLPPTFSEAESRFTIDPTRSGNTCGMVVNETVDKVPTTAWRTIDVPGYGVVMLHQRARTAEVQVTSGGYGGRSKCSSSIVQSAITTAVDAGAYNTASTDLPDMTLAVDLAVDSGGTRVAVVAPGNWGHTPQVRVFPLTGEDGLSQFVTNAAQQQPATPSSASAAVQVRGCFSPDQQFQPQGQATAVAFVTPSVLAIQEREPAAISFIDATTGKPLSRLDLEQPSRFDTGHAIFHMRAGAGIACASCHAEAGDDGHVWSFHGIGARRTQSLRGGILGTAPFHWNGDMQSFPALVTEVFVGRMSGFAPQADQTDALAHWIDKQPRLQTHATDLDAAERGKALFESAAVGCTRCHSGALFTNNATENVGTGTALQVPALRGVSFRMPLMHDGCAVTLESRFGPCGGGDRHGHTSQLGSVEIGDLVAYLETL